VTPPEISALPQEYQNILDLAQDRYNIHVHLLDELRGGRTGALLYLVSVTPLHDTHVEHYVLKLDIVEKKGKLDEITRHNLALNQAPHTFSRQHIAELAFEAKHEDCLAVFYAIAGGSLLQFRPLAFYERQNQLETIFRATNDYLLKKWNAGLTFDQVVHPQNLLESWLGYRLKPTGRIAGFMEDALKIEQDTCGFLIHDKVFPNPLVYSRDAGLWEVVRPIDTIIGFQHGDLNMSNILVKFAGTETDLDGYYLIDFDLYKDQMPLLFDQRYLEMSYLIRELERSSFEKWVDFVTQYAIEDTPDPHKVPMDFAGACGVINAGRAAFSEWLQLTHASLVDDLWGQFWLAGAATGLNFCNKKALSNQERLASLIYAAAHLKRYCDQFGVPPPVEVSPLYDPGKPLDIKEGIGLRAKEGLSTDHLAARPTGTITFLFTDIVGSTQLWENHPENMAAALVRHDAIIERTVAANDGHIFKQAGDGFCVAFQTAIDAVSAALEGQLALQAESWGETGPLQVRMALYTGEADELEGDYFGPVINRVSRLQDVTHGRQILISQSTWELVYNQMNQDINLLDLGQHWLKDIPQPEQIYQILAPGLPVEFPPLPTVSSQTRHLLEGAAAFVGRQGELNQISKLLQVNSLVTLSGPGGIGKTRLALAVAEAQSGNYRQGVHFVPLLSIDIPIAVVPAIASVLDLTFLEGRTPQAQLLDYLRSRQMLLVLDNMEQLLVDENAVETLGLIEAMLSAAPELKLLVTSRELLRLSNEQAFLVKGLSVSDHDTEGGLIDECAVELFYLRARNVQPSFETDRADNLHHVQQFCRMVEGMPLAIELAAAQLRLLSLADIISDIKANLDVLDTGLRGEAARHGSIRAVFETTWQNLSVDIQQIFSRLSVFRGGFTLQAASQVARASIQNLILLMDKSFIGKDADGRFALHALLQMFASEKLLENPVEKSETQERHYLYYMQQLAGAVDGWRDSYQTDSFDAIKLEVENLRAGWKWILTTQDWEAAAAYSEDLWQFLKVQGRLPEAMELLDQAISTGQAAEPPTNPIHLAHWERRIGQAYLWLSKFNEGQEHFHRAISFLEWPIPDGRISLLMGVIVQLITQILHRAWPGYFFGRSAKKQAGIKEAFIAYEQISQRAAFESDAMLSAYCGFRCLNLAEAAEIQPLMARAYATTGYMFGMIPSHYLAESYLNRAEELIEIEHAPEIRMWTSYVSGYYYFGKGELERAESNILVAAKLAGELGQHWNKENSWNVLLHISLLKGEWDRSLYYVSRIRSSARLRGDAGFEAAALYSEATIKLQRGDMDDVIALLEESASAPEEVMMIFDWILVHASFARAYCRQGELALASEKVNKLSRLIAQISRPTAALYMLGYAGAASVYLYLWNLEAGRSNRSGLQASARRACKDLQDLARIFPVAKPQAWLNQGLYDWLSGKPGKAYSAWQKSLDYARNLDLVYQQGLVHYEIGRHLSAGEHTDDGWGGREHLLCASEIFTDLDAAYDLRCAQEALGNLKK